MLPLKRESGFYIQYVLVLKKDGGVCLWAKSVTAR